MTKTTRTTRRANAIVFAVLAIGCALSASAVIAQSGPSPGAAATPRREFRASHAEIEAVQRLNGEMAQVQAAYANVERRSRAVFADVRTLHHLEPDTKIGFDDRNPDAVVWFVVEDVAPIATSLGAPSPAAGTK